MQTRKSQSIEPKRTADMRKHMLGDRKVDCTVRREKEGAKRETDLKEKRHVAAHAVFLLVEVRLKSCWRATGKHHNKLGLKSWTIMEKRRDREHLELTCLHGSISLSKDNTDNEPPRLRSRDTAAPRSGPWIQRCRGTSLSRLPQKKYLTLHSSQQHKIHDRPRTKQTRKSQKTSQREELHTCASARWETEGGTAKGKGRSEARDSPEGQGVAAMRFCSPK